MQPFHYSQELPGTRQPFVLNRRVYNALAAVPPAWFGSRVSIVTIQVEIDHGKVTPIEPQLLPETGRGVLTILSASQAAQTGTCLVGTAEDGLPVIRAQGGTITSAMVREIEGLSA